MAELEPPKPSVEDLLQIQLVTLMRIYDVVLAQLRADHQELGKAVEAKHSKFEYLGPLPFVEE